MSARRSGLGRGLDSLIPDKIGSSGSANKKTVQEEPKKHTPKAPKSGKGKSAKKKSDNIPVMPAEKEEKKKSDHEETLSAEVRGKETSRGLKQDSTASASASDERKPATETSVERSTETPSAETEEHAAVDGQVVELKISLVEPNRNQPRKTFKNEAIDELSDSIRQYGIIQPLLVQKQNDYYQIIAGERRWRAAKKAGLKTVPVIIKDFSSQTAVEVSLIENIQREDLNPMEEAKAYERLVRDYHMSQEEVAEKVSKNRSTVANSMRLLRLTEKVQQFVADGLVTEGHARALLGIADPVTQTAAAEEVIQDHLNVRDTEKLVRTLTLPKKDRRHRLSAETETMLESLSEQLKNTLGTKVEIHQNRNYKGKIEIEYYSEEELDRLFELLKSVR